MYFYSENILILYISFTNVDIICQYFILIIYPMPFSILFLQEANNLEKSTTKTESAWLFRMWYGFDHKYPLTVMISQMRPHSRD